MRATALLQRLPHSATVARPRRARRQRRQKPDGHTAATSMPSLHPTAPASGEDATVRARLAGGPIDNASYTCSCGFVFAASVSTTVACPHCGAGQAW
jgi:hypothetical protein